MLSGNFCQVPNISFVGKKQIRLRKHLTPFALSSSSLPILLVQCCKNTERFECVIAPLSFNIEGYVREGKTIFSSSCGSYVKYSSGAAHSYNLLNYF